MACAGGGWVGIILIMNSARIGRRGGSPAKPSRLPKTSGLRTQRTPQPARARRPKPVRLTQAAKGPNSNLPFTAACLAARRRAAAFAGRHRRILATALRQAREAQGRKKYNVALRGGVSRDMQGRVEAGRSSPTFFVLCKILFSLGLTWGQLAKIMKALAAK